MQKNIICIFKNGKKSIFAPEKSLKLPKMQFFWTRKNRISRLKLHFFFHVLAHYAVPNQQIQVESRQTFGCCTIIIAVYSVIIIFLSLLLWFFFSINPLYIILLGIVSLLKFLYWRWIQRHISSLIE